MIYTDFTLLTICLLSDSTNKVYHPKVSPNQKIFNPYPMLGAPSLPCWPRGMPLHMVLNDGIKELKDNTYIYQNGSYDNTQNVNFAVLQSVADIQPDVDAIYRLTRGTPFSFVRPEPMISPNIQKGKFLEYINIAIRIVIS